MPQVERTLIDADESETVRQTRHVFQKTMEPLFTKAVAEIMGRNVIAFFSQVHFDPDMSVEAFVLEPAGDEVPTEA